MRPVVLFAFSFVLALACTGGPLEPVASAPTAAPPSSPGAWPVQSGAAWPKGCLIENAGLHPSQPWLTVACTEAEGESGAVMVFDLHAGVLRNVVPLEGFVGWRGSDFLQWHPDGDRLVSNIATNGIQVLKGAAPLGQIHPDDTRDGGVGAIWVGDMLYTDTGHLVLVQEGDLRFDFAHEARAPGYQVMRWNRERGEVIGWEQSRFVALDPFTMSRSVELETASAHLGCAPDGQWCAGRRTGAHPAPDTLVLVDASKGTLQGPLSLSSPIFHGLAWAPSGGFAATSYVHTIGGPPSRFMVDIWQGGELRTRIPLGDRTPSAGSGVDELAGLAFSPDARSLAVLLKTHDILLFDAGDGGKQGQLSAPSAPVPASLPAWYAQEQRTPGAYPGSLAWGAPDRLVRIGGHFVSIWSTQGEKVAEFIVPTR